MNVSTNSTTQKRIVDVVAGSGVGVVLRNIAKQLPDVPVNTIRGSLTKLAARGLVEKGGLGWRKAGAPFLPNV